MLKSNVLPADTYVVMNKTILSEQDRKTVIMLYQPIIGSVAVSLYLTFWSYLDRNELFSLEWTHHHLMTNMGLKLDDIIEAREKLEGIGLIKTYLKKDHIHNFVYELYSPLSPAEFIGNPILSVTLYNNVGKKEYEKVTSYFKTPRVSLKEYEDITCMFSDVFDTTSKTIIEAEDGTYKQKNKRDLSLISKIDLSSILGLLPEEYLNIRSVTKETKDLIYKLAFIYHLDDDSLLDIIRNSISEKRTIDKKLLRDHARKYYEFEHSGKLPSIIYKNQPEYLRKPVGDTSKRAKAIYTFETVSPYIFLSSKYKGGKPPKSELLILEYLAVDLDLKPGVINVLVDYILKINSSKLTKNFAITIAAQFKKAGIETVEDAMQLAEKEYKTRKHVKDTKVQKAGIKPEWFDKNVKKENVKEEEKEELEKMLEGFR
ncbi:MAG: DnaD domain protein [Bacilli bacterium]|nr:DnaD domain protein [Bacilli bacterium]